MLILLCLLEPLSVISAAVSVCIDAAVLIAQLLVQELLGLQTDKELFQVACPSQSFSGSVHLL